MKLQQVLSFTRRAVDDYHMIQAGDKIAIGISGGKDSSARRLALLKKVNLPEHMSTNAMLQALDLLYTLEELTQLVGSLETNHG